MTTDFSPGIQEWQRRGQVHTFFGLEVFALETGPRDATETLLLLHGFPSSSYDWAPLLPLLPPTWRLITLDLPGFGLSSKPAGAPYSLFEQADIVEQVLRAHGVSRAHVLAHDMGTTVACELLARRERGLLSFTIPSLTLTNGSVYIELAHLTPSQKILRTSIGPLFAQRSTQKVFVWQLKRILGKPVSDDALDEMWRLMVYRDGVARLAETIGYVSERWKFAERWTGALTRLNIPMLILWGRLDPVAVPAIAEKLAREIPGARLEWMEALGHYPQLEDPLVVATALRTFHASVT